MYEVYPLSTQPVAQHAVMPTTDAPVRLLLEEDSLTELAKQAVSDAFDSALDLESLGTFGKDALNETFHILTPEDLREKASRLRCVAQEGQRLSAELHRIAGQFEALGRLLAIAQPLDHAESERTDGALDRRCGSV